MDWSLEVVILPVSDIDRSVPFYRDQVGFHLDHDTRNEFMQVSATLASPDAFRKLKDSLTGDPSIAVEVRTDEEMQQANFGVLYRLFDFVAYFIGAVMASGRTRPPLIAPMTAGRVPNVISTAPARTSLSAGAVPR